MTKFHAMAMRQTLMVKIPVSNREHIKSNSRKSAFDRLQLVPISRPTSVLAASIRKPVPSVPFYAHCEQEILFKHFTLMFVGSVFSLLMGEQNFPESLRPVLRSRLSVRY